MNWRASWAFRYLFLPVRLVAALVALIGASVAAVGIYLMWLNPEHPKRFWRGAQL